MRIGGEPRPAGRAGTDPLRHHHPHDPDLSLACARARHIFPLQSADLDPDPLWVLPETWLKDASLDATCPLSVDLAPDHFGASSNANSLIAALQTCPCQFVSSTEVLGFRCPPDPGVLEDVAADGVLIGPPGTAVLSI